jgi:hypothetical protein
MDEEQVETATATVGDSLRVAREEKGLSLEDIASQTRIPQRHLESLEQSAWDRLPAPTYTIGFARSYAGVVGLDRADVAERLRAEMGGHRPQTMTPAEVFEPADPARAMPKWLVLGAIAAVILVVIGMSWLNERSLNDSGDVPDNAVVATAEQPAPAAVAPAAPQAATGPVVLTATAPAWIQVTDNGKTLFSGELAPGQRFEVPVTATAPRLKAGKPEALQVTVGNQTAPPVGPPGKVAANVSLLAADLMRGPAAAVTTGAPAAPTSAPRTVAPAPRRQPARRTDPAPSPATPPPPVEPPASTTPGQ